MSFLLVIKGPNIGLRYELGDRTRIGRLGENEIQVADPNVSRVHAEIIKDRMAFTIHDRGSKNGLLINGKETNDKILLRNDEIQVGNTVFLFNSELNIRNARFSNNSVYLYPANDETVQSARKQSALDQLQGRERESIEFVLKFAELFSAPPAPLADTAERLMTQVQTLFQADTAILMLREGEDFRPVVALPAGRPAGINRALVASVIEEKSGLVSSERVHLPPMQDESNLNSSETPLPTERRRSNSPDAGNRTADSEIEKELAPVSGGGDLTPMSTLCVPIMEGENVIGMFILEKAELDSYSLRDLGLLQAVARLATGTIEAGRLLDRESVRAASRAHDEGKLDTANVANTRSLRIQEILNAARRSAETPVTVLVTGETGTGKELLARYIHEHSPRTKGPFIAVNCGAIPANLFESELFGFEKGAFTGANKTTAGKVEAAQGGTLFLDEIGELDISLQPKLLRFLQDKAFYRVGGTRAIDADVRIVAATNVDLAAAVRAGAFREDLWYRLNVVPFHMPALRERREDIAPLVDAMVVKYAATLNRRILGANDAALSLLQKYDWPGNIRELENAIERAVLLSNGKILTITDFAHIDEARRRTQSQTDLERKRDTKPLAEVERQHIIVALKKYSYNQARAAEALGLHRNTLRNKIIEYGIDIPK
jgi:transcriptional regulator with GAF, ATPase, and Fis domain/pSer/pThr/pTyr-binding forkhead associated (FHA) protein